MDKEIIEVPVMSAKVRSLGLPCSTAVRANGFVFISATPPVDGDRRDGARRHQDRGVAEGAETLPGSGWHLA